MEITKVVSSCLASNCYIVSFDNFCIVIDPSVSYEEISNYTNLQVKYVFITHAHFDHIYKIDTYLNKGITFVMHENAFLSTNSPKHNLSFLSANTYQIKVDLKDEKYLFVNDNKYNIENISFKVINTLGHSFDSVTYIFDNNMFTGDFLFCGSIGRTDFPTSNNVLMNESINKIKKIKEDYFVYPGHGESTKLQYEIKYNYYFRNC